MYQEVKDIFCKYQIDEWEIVEPTDFLGETIVKTKVRNEAFLQELHNFVNRRAIAFGMEGPYRIIWEPL